MEETATVFTPEWVGKLRRRWEPQPPFQQPPIFGIATGSYCADIRAEVEEWVRLLPERGRKSVVARLRSSEQFMNTYHELAAGHILRMNGYSAEYEPEVCGKAPDWLAHEPGGGRSFLLEAVSCNTPEEQRRRRSGWQKLRERLKRIPIGVWLEPEMEDDGPTITDQMAVRIEKDVRAWLRTKPPVGTEIRTSGVLLRVDAIDDAFARVCFIPPPEAFWTDLDRLRDAIADKASKYGDICASENLPLVVSVVTSFGTGLGMDDFDEVLNGGIVYHVRCSDRMAFPVRQPDGLFARYPMLHAVVNLFRNGGGWHTRVLRNPDALPSLGGPLFSPG